MPIESEDVPDAKEIAHRIRTKIADLNDDLILAALAEVKVDFEIRYFENAGEATSIKVWCSQEVI